MQEMRNNFFFKETHIELHMVIKTEVTVHTHTPVIPETWSQTGKGTNSSSHL